MLEKTDTTLTCTACDRDTVHRVVYLHKKVLKITCRECGKDFRFYSKHPIEHYMLSTAEQLFLEPSKLNREFHEEGASFLFSLPRRVITKPYRMMREFSEFLDVLSEG